ncbi:MAG: ANTAR domain-containing protein [Oscillospiraceae bacterium]|jgi:hypothetical protein|nr:ANTAR domain-containing protein [Oscillospiraceae bacterium]
MKEILLAAASPDVMAALRRVLSEVGITEVRPCRSGTDALGACSRVRDGLLICHRLRDIPPITLARTVPGHIDVLLLLPSSQPPLEGVSNVLCMNLPLDKPDFLRTVQAILANGQQRRQALHRRGAEDEAVILEAKRRLLERESMPEWAAHRWLQQRAMHSGRSLVEVAKEVLAV